MSEKEEGNTMKSGAVKGQRRHVGERRIQLVGLVWTSLPVAHQPVNALRFAITAAINVDHQQGEIAIWMSSIVDVDRDMRRLESILRGQYIAVMNSMIGRKVEMHIRNRVEEDAGHKEIVENAKMASDRIEQRGQTGQVIIDILQGDIHWNREKYNQHGPNLPTFSSS